MNPDLLTIPQAAEYTNMTVRWIKRAVSERRIEIVKFGRLVRIPRRALDDLIEAGRKPPISEPSHSVTPDPDEDLYQ